MQLLFCGMPDNVNSKVEVTSVRITGGVIWTWHDHGLLASFSSGAWKHRGVHYPIVILRGPACLSFGIARDPCPISEPIEEFSVTGTSLSANGVPFAEYVEERDAWQGTLRPAWWSGMRFIDTHLIPQDASGTSVLLYNPWDPATRHFTAEQFFPPGYSSH